MQVWLGWVEILILALIKMGSQICNAYSLNKYMRGKSWGEDHVMGNAGGSVGRQSTTSCSQKM